MLKRILVLDDNADILDVLQEVLSYEKFEVKITSNGLDIIEIVKTFQPHLLILDYKLNGPNGDDICRKIKGHHQLCDIPVIICSAYLDHEDMLNFGCDATIAKPFGLEELMDKVNSLVYV
jgi:DNA-binding response OmpR family regulator